MTDAADHFPRRYFVDKEGRRVLIGLSREETFEFETLDSLPPIDDGDHIGWDDNGIPMTAREKRWLDLYGKHDDAWRQWMLETHADRATGLTFFDPDRVT